MVIRPSKFEAVIVCTFLICISFFFALKSEKTVTTSVNGAEIAEIPIIMYHHITKDEKKCGKYTVHKNEFENDLKYIKENGYTTVTVKDLINFTNGKETLPEKPIMLTFDDGFESFYVLAYPLLEKYNSKAVVAVIGSVTEKYSEIDDHNINYSNLNFDELKFLNSTKLVEIQNHSFDMHQNASGKRKGVSKLKSESEQQYTENLIADLNKCYDVILKNTGIKMTAVAYPFGAYNKTTLKIIKDLGYQCTLTCEEKVGKIEKGNPDSLFDLGRYNRPSGISTEAFFSKFSS